MDNFASRELSRRALLNTALGAGVAAALGAACGTSDADVFAGGVAEPVPTTTTEPPTTTTTQTTEPPTTVPESTTTSEATQPADEPAEPAPESTAGGSVAVAGEMVVTFTYTQGAGGKNEPPYVAVWIEDTAGRLVETVALFYEQGRRGGRWLDHLDRWFSVDAVRIAGGGEDTAATISSATRLPGVYTVAWDGSVGGVAAPSGPYFLCIEAVRENGPHSLIREAVDLTGSLPPTPLPGDGELSEASVRIDA